MSLSYIKLVSYKYISRSDVIDMSTSSLSHLTYFKCLHSFSVSGSRPHIAFECGGHRTSGGSRLSLYTTRVL